MNPCRNDEIFVELTALGGRVAPAIFPTPYNDFIMTLRVGPGVYFPDDLIFDCTRLANHMTLDYNVAANESTNSKPAFRAGSACLRCCEMSK